VWCYWAYEYQRFLTPDKHANVKTCLARTVERKPLLSGGCMG